MVKLDKSNKVQSKRKLVSKDTPLAELTLRKYEKPVRMKDRELVKKVCLSIGLLQPGDSRDIIVDILLVLLKSDHPLNSREVEDRVIDNRKREKLQLVGIASSNIRRQLKRLRDSFIIEKVANDYRITENANLGEVFYEKIRKYYLDSIVNRVQEYFDAVKQIR